MIGFTMVVRTLCHRQEHLPPPGAPAMGGRVSTRVTDKPVRMKDKITMIDIIKILRWTTQMGNFNVLVTNNTTQKDNISGTNKIKMMQNIKVTGNIQMTDNINMRNNIKMTDMIDNIKMTDNSKVMDNIKVTDNSRTTHNKIVTDKALLTDRSRVSVRTRTRSPIQVKDMRKKIMKGVMAVVVCLTGAETQISQTKALSSPL